jgi:hypothetical protein
METSISYTTKDKAFFSSDERRWINRIRTLKEKYPDMVQVIAEPEDNDGCIYASIPIEWMKIQPKRAYTDEQKAEMVERLRRA